MTMGKLQVFKFDFADPLALAIAEGTGVSDEDGEILGLQIQIAFNSMSSVILVEEPSYTGGVGYGSIIMTVDGTEIGALAALSTAETNSTTLEDDLAATQSQ